MNKRKICIVTGSRAEYGLLYPLIKKVNEDDTVELQLLVTGSHLVKEFGFTYKEIEKNFKIDKKIDILSYANSVGIAKSMAKAQIEFTKTFKKFNPDIVVLLGDRYEIFSVAVSATILNIPIAHIHGGEATYGANDEVYRHAITKMSHLHFTATKEYKKRVIQLGEAPDRVKNVGAIGLDHLSRSSFMTLDELSKSLNFAINHPYILVTYHPVTLADEEPEQSFQALLDSLDEFPDYQIILTYPNADDGGRRIIPLLEGYASKNSKRTLAIKSLGQIRYLSAVKNAAAVVGNSSSGIIEVPSFDVATIDIGMRQRGRLAAKSVIHCSSKKNDIVNAINYGIHKTYKVSDEKIHNPYGQGDATVRPPGSAP